MSYDQELAFVDMQTLGGSTHGSSYGLAALAVDRNNRIHVLGTTTDNQLEVVDPVQAQRGGASDAYVMTFNPTNSAVPFNTYLGGAVTEVPTDIAVDGGGNRWVVGYTLSGDFPTTAGSLQRNLKGRTDGFVVKISAN